MVFCNLLLPYLFFRQVNNKKAKQSIMCCWSKCIFIIQQINSSVKLARCQEKIGIAMDTEVSVSGHSEWTQVQLWSSLSVSQRNELLVIQSMAVHPCLQLELQPWLHPPDNLLSFHTPLRLKGLGSQHSVLPSLFRTHPRSKHEPVESYNFVRQVKTYSSLSEFSAQYNISAPEHQTAAFWGKKIKRHYLNGKTGWFIFSNQKNPPNPGPFQ